MAHEPEAESQDLTDPYTTLVSPFLVPAAVCLNNLGICSAGTTWLLG